jgi:cytochrome c oxidase assembly protein subunit 15
MQSFRRITISTLVAVYVLILVGGIVRSTGSGMGCPDWPKCFGSWVPPTSVNDLPDNYKEIYSAYRDKKNQRFAKYLGALGMNETAAALLNDPGVRTEADFNPTKTWIEYLNRVVGVIIGLMIVAVAAYSLRFRKTDLQVTLVAFAALVVVIFTGWIGSFVVSSNLTPWTITVHMFLALFLVALLVYLVFVSGDNFGYQSASGYVWLIVSIALLLVQTLLGTQVREAIDMVAASSPRTQWLDNLDGDSFVIHRSFSWIVLLVHVGLIFRLPKTQGVKAFSLTVILLILGTILTGTAMAYAGVPAFLQPLHLLLATVTFGVQFYLLLNLREVKKYPGAKA